MHEIRRYCHMHRSLVGSILRRRIRRLPVPSEAIRTIHSTSSTDVMAHRMLDIARQRSHCVAPLCRWRQVPGVGIVRARHQTNGNNGNKTTTADESQLNWKERSEAPKWMQRIAPTRGGRLSELKWYEATAIAAGCAVFYWAWFVAEPPKPAVAVVQDADDGKSSR